MKRSLVRTVALVLALVVFAAPVGARERPRAPRGAETVTVKMRDNRFVPRSITIPRGTIVRWVNRGNNIHTSTSDRGLWNSGTLGTGDTFRRRFRQSGTFSYHCNIHPFMMGTITVT